MPRFFIAGSSIGKGVTVLTGSDAQHAHVLRLKIGDELVLCDGEGTDYRCRVQALERDEVLAQVLDSYPSAAEPSVAVTVLCALPKGARADYIVQKCTECGAAEIVFFQSRRCVARADEKSMEQKLPRFRRIAEEAAKQSGRGIIPRLKAVPGLVEALDLAVKTDLPLFFYETGERRPLRSVLEENPGITSAAIITGPEGGFEPYEADMAAAVGLSLCSMGPRIFRCETAPVAALSALMYATGNL